MTFAIRTVKNGSVTVNGVQFFVGKDTNLPYDGRWDGKRFAFALYYIGDRQQMVIALWGTEEYYKSYERTLETSLKNHEICGTGELWYWSWFYPSKDFLVSRWEAESDPEWKWWAALEICHATHDESYMDLMRVKA